MELLISRLLRVPDFCHIFCLIKDVLCDFVWFTKTNKCTFAVFMSLFIIPSQVLLAKFDQRCLEKRLLCYDILSGNFPDATILPIYQG